MVLRGTAKKQTVRSQDGDLRANKTGGGGITPFLAGVLTE